MKQPGKHFMPKELKYPLFFLGLFLIIGGGLATIRLDMSLAASEAVAAVGFIVLTISIILT
jgi:hypothetical protein